MLCLQAVNAQLAGLLGHVSEDSGTEEKDDHLMKEGIQIRANYEMLLKLFCQHEATFSLQILGGIITTCMVLFSSLSSFFKPDLNVTRVAIYGLSFVTGIYILFLTCLFPIQLYEEVLHVMNFIWPYQC